jgi:hypothetical protein
MTVGLLAPIFEQMEPLKIGEDYRSTRIAEEYALRLDAAEPKPGKWAVYEAGCGLGLSPDHMAQPIRSIG